MNDFYRSIARNNDSVALMASGRYEAAMEGQTQALSMIKQFMDTHGDGLPVSSSQQQQEESSSKHPLVIVGLDQCMAQSCCSSSMKIESCSQETEEEEEFLYENGIIIPSALTLDQDMGAMVSCMIIFNFALACQLCAMYSNDNDDDIITNLNKAIKLYQLSFNLQRNARMDNNVLFSLALVNNLGLAHRLLQNQEDSGKCFEYVLSTLMFLTDCGECSKLFEQQHLDGFFFNVTNLISTSTAPAA
jgi:hypothetical protein